jgi:hypothetical protein
MTDHISSRRNGKNGNKNILIGPNGPISYKPEFVIPAPFRVWCHQCNTGIMSINDVAEHDRIVHNNKHGR